MNKSRKILSVLALAAFGLSSAGIAPVRAASLPLSNAANNPAALGTIRGIIRDENGAPVAGAVIALIRDGAAVIKQVRSTAGGSFSARVAPGRYTLTAMADGFSVASVSNVDVDRAGDVAYRFNLVRVGSGNTLPERRADRNNAKWRIRASQRSRGIFQQNQGTGETLAGVEKIETADNTDTNVATDSSVSLIPQGAVETYFASSENPNGGNYVGLNFAVAQPVSENVDLIFGGQTGFGDAAPQRFETAARIKAGNRHKLNFNFGGAKLGSIEFDDAEEAELGQISFGASDEWRVRDNLILVIGFDYARFIGASEADSIAPRFGLQFDANAKTRLTAAYTVQHEPRTWQQAAELEDSRILFREPSFEPYAVADRETGKEILMPRLRRFEFGVERILDNASNIEAVAFFDLTSNRGVSFINLPLAAFADAEDEFSTATQNGDAQGVRVVYSRRLNEVFSTSFGYAAGRGQELSPGGLTNPADLFADGFFQTVAVEFAGDFKTGTKIRTVYRFAPRGAVFAIDPFAGRMAVFDPSMSVLVTQGLPTWGLPIRAKAMIDARNIFDLQTATADGDNTLKLNSSRRVLRGGIAVRF